MLKITYRILSTVVLFCFINCAQAADTAKSAVQSAYANWCTAVGEAKGNPATMVKFYAPDAILLPTLSPKILVNHRGGLDAYFVKFTSQPNIKCIPKKLMTQIYGDIAINSGLYNFSLKDSNGKRKMIAARFTFVYKANGNDWQIINHHSSILPEMSQ